MDGLNFDPDNTLAGGLYGMTPKEAVALALSLCEAVEQSVGADGCHGGVWPGNITAADGKVALGEPNRVGITDMSPDAMEFVSPEQFWSGQNSPAADVYSIGLVLYTALNRGVMPWFGHGGDHKPEERAAALQNRMKGKALPYPETASRALGEVVLKALAFRAEDRYATPGQLKAALLGLPESASMAAAVPVVPVSPGTAPNYSVDKQFESTAPVREKKPKKARKQKGEVDEDMDVKEFRGSHKGKKSAWRIIVPILLVLIIIAAVLFLLKGCMDEEPREFVVETEDPGSQIHEPVPETDIPGIVTTPEPTPDPTPTPEPTEPPEPSFELVMADVSWQRAKELAEQRGGHLATVRNEEQLQEIIEKAQNAGARFVWLGAFRADDGVWEYVTGEVLDYAVWDTGEPSALDTDGTREDYLLLWYRPATGLWRYNDMRNDPVSLLPATYGGRTAYVIEYD